MFEKCIECNRIGESCIPNLMRSPFPDLIQWCNKRQKHLGWTNQTLAFNSNVPAGTINRIKSGDYMDCKYSTIRSVVITLVGGTVDEFPCNEQVKKELLQLEEQAKQAEKLSATEARNAALELRLSEIDEQHRKDIRAIKEEYQEQIAFLKDELKAWREMQHK